MRLRGIKFTAIHKFWWKNFGVNCENLLNLLKRFEWQSHTPTFFLPRCQTTAEYKKRRFGAIEYIIAHRHKGINKHSMWLFSLGCSERQNEYHCKKFQIYKLMLVGLPVNQLIKYLEFFKVYFTWKCSHHIENFCV